MASPNGLEADPFLQAQDFIHRRLEAIRRYRERQQRRLRHDAGNPKGRKAEPNKLRVDLHKETGAWKIVKVTRLPLSAVYRTH